MISKTPLISVIVPNYNHERFLKERLDSILNQTYTVFEVILLDDCSTDNSQAILLEYAKYPKVSQCIFNEVNSGNTFFQWKKGIELAMGDYIWIAESDDSCELNFLEKILEPFLKDAQVVLSYCQSNRINEFSAITGNWISHTDNLSVSYFLQDFIVESHEFIEQFFICKNVIPNASAVLIKKEAIDLQHHFDLVPEFRYCGDWMFYFKLIVIKKIAFISESLNNFRYHSNSVIARAVESEKRISIIDIDFKMRAVLMQYLYERKLPNIAAIKAKNRFIKRNFLTYEKAILFIQTGKKIKGYFYMLTAVDVYVQHNSLKKSIKRKITRIFKFKY